MPLVNAAKNAMLDELASLATHISLHSADPSTSGANEIAGGSPAYARKAATWSAASSGVLSLSNDPVFDVEGGDTVSYVGIFSASTSGTFYGSANVTDEVFGGQGTYTLTALTVTINDS